MKQKLTSADLKADLAKAEKELQDLLERTTILREWITVTKKICGKRHSTQETQELPLTFVPRRRTKTTELATQVREILGKIGRPMHVNFIAIELDRKGHPIDAKNPAATLAVALSRRPDEFARVGPNTFDLAKKDAEAQAVG